MGTLFATTVANAKPQDKVYKLSDAVVSIFLSGPTGQSSGASFIAISRNIARSPSAHGRTSARPTRVSGETRRAG